jgi:ABC-type glycerol-3-phosphate transport system permease component
LKTSGLVKCGILLAVPAALALPFIWTVLSSFLPREELLRGGSPLQLGKLTTQNYALVLGTGFPRSIANSFAVTLPGALISILITFPAAYAFSRFTFRFKGLVLAGVLFTQLFPFVVLITPVFLALSKLGLVNTRPGLIATYAAITSPLAVFLFIRYIDTVPRELDEAARVDGATMLQTLRRVIVPISLPAIASVGIYVFATTWIDYIFAFALLTRPESRTVQVELANFIGEAGAEWQYVLPAAVLAAIPTIFVFSIFQRGIVQNISGGAVKG